MRYESDKYGGVEINAALLNNNNAPLIGTLTRVKANSYFHTQHAAGT